MSRCKSAGPSDAECTLCATGWGGTTCDEWRGAATSSAAVVLVFVAAFAYLAIGGAWNMQKNGLRGKAALPHRRQWADLAALVQDGIAFTRGKALPVAASRVSPSAVSRSSQKKSKKEKKQKVSRMPSGSYPDAEKAEQLLPDTISQALPAAKSPPAAVATAEGTAAGGGGRWVHVPTT